jgi:hypothetical protein
MQPLSAYRLGPRIVIWSIQYQDRISYCFRLYMGALSVIVIFLGMLGAVPLESALWSLFSSGLLIIGAAWFLIQKRKSWLMNIKDPELKQLAYDTMLAYIVLKGRCVRQANLGKECTGSV